MYESQVQVGSESIYKYLKTTQTRCLNLDPLTYRL